MERMEGAVLSTVFRNDENGYSVLSVRFGREEFAVTGVLPEFSDGEKAWFSGEWVEHKVYGRQFKCVRVEIIAPTAPDEIERYLAGGTIRGIGASTARLIVQRFGEETLNVLSDHPEKLLKIPGIGKKKLAMITESFRAQQETRRSAMFLQGYDVPPALAKKIIDRYRDRTPEILQTNPYRLCLELEGVGFLTADRIGMKMGIAPDNENRVRSALHYTLQEAAWSSGHIWLPEEELLRAAGDMLQVPRELCARGLTAMLLRRSLVAEEDETFGRRIYIPSFYDNEKEVAGRLRELLSYMDEKAPAGAKRTVAAFEKRNGITFSPLQREAILRSAESGVFVITGGPGTGKTTLLKCMLDLLGPDHDILLCAPTGRAAKRMSEATGEEAMTIHRMLEYNPGGGFARDPDNPLEGDCVIADEASMIDQPLMLALLRALEPGTRLILVGDADQLPSVGPGNILGDILRSGVIPCVRLTDIFRQSELSRIALNAHRINGGEMPLLNGKDTDFFFERRTNFPDAAAAMVDLAASRLPLYLGYRGKKDPPSVSNAMAARNIQVLSPTKKGLCGVVALNKALQAALNPPAAGLPEIEGAEYTFRLGDKVIQVRNNYDLDWIQDGVTGSGVFNGDVGFITGVDRGDRSLTVRFDDDREAEYSSADLEDLNLAYCLSVHKSQGSEFPVVVLSVAGGPSMLLTRNLFYTAVTRARSLAVLVGSEEVIRTMVTNDHEARRYTTLTLRLTEWEEAL